MKRNRYIILLSAGILAAVLGSEHVWSIFSDPLRQVHDCTPSRITLTYSLFVVFGMVGVFLFGVLSKWIKPKYIALLGGTMQGGGFFLAGFAGSVPMLYLTYSVIGGIGNGLLYNGSVSVATDWFPDKKGTASGICVGFLGLAPVVWSLSGGVLIDKYGVRAALCILGGIMVVITWIVSWFIERAPDGYVPEGWTPDGYVSAGKVSDTLGTENRTAETSLARDYRPAEMVRTPLFYCVMAGLFLHVLTGLSMTGNAAAMAKVIVGMTDKQASLQVAILAVGSFLGRIIFGALSDKIGRFHAQVILMLMTAADMLLFIGRANTFGLFMAAVAVCGAGYGGTVAIFPALVSDCFGQKHFSSNYSIVFLGFTLAGVVGPMITSLIYQHTGSYQGAFVFAGLIAIAGAGAALLTKHFYYKR